MAQNVWSFMAWIEPSSVESPPDHRINCGRVAKPANRGSHTNKDSSCRAAGPTMAKIACQCFAYILWQRQSVLPAALSAHLDFSCFPMDVIQGHVYYFP